MDGQAITDLIREALTGYRYEPPPDGTIGVPWTADKVRARIEELIGCLVAPYLQRFELRESFPQISVAAPSFANYWVVAESSDHLEWYDPTTGEFGLGQRVDGSDVPVSIGARGDLIGVFCAM